MTISHSGMRWQSFTAAPHRMLFFGGVVAIVLSMLWWTAILAAYTGLVPMLPFSLPPIWLHAWLMVYGIFPFFVLGFLMTAFVRWIGAPPLSPRIYQPVALGLFAGYVLVLMGALIAPIVVALGMAITAAAWLGGVLALGLRLRAHLPTRSPHPPWAMVLLVAGWSGAVISALGAFGDYPALLAAGPQLGIWAFLAPMVFVVAHRMVPFFAQAALHGYTAFRPQWAPPTGALLFVLHAILLISDLTQWLWLADVPLACLSGWLLWRWQPWRARGNPLLWSLFVAYFWMPVALALSAAGSIALALNGIDLFGRAPLHLLTVGLLTSMVMAMATRVSRGHSGRLLAMDQLSIACFLVLQLAVVTRLVAELPGLEPVMYPLLTGSGVLWLLAMVPWACHYGRIYWQPRIDGKPG